MRASSISLDNDEEEGIAHGAVLSFKGVPVLPVPAISFPLTDKRKSGVLVPSLGVDSVNGVEVILHGDDGSWFKRLRNAVRHPLFTPGAVPLEVLADA